MSDRDAMVRIIFDRADWSDPLGGAELAADDLLAAGWMRAGAGCNYATTRAQPCVRQLGHDGGHSTSCAWEEWE